MCLDYMFLTKIIDKKFHRGKESLRIKEKDSDIGDKDKFLEEFSDAERLERNGDNEENDENTGKKQGKARKISNDEEKILELRSELTNRAEQQEKLMADEDNSEDGSSSLSNYSESDSDATELTANGEVSGNLCRLDEIERKLARIESRLNEKDNEKDSERRKIDRVRDEQYVQLMVRTERLEVENKTLKDENYGLRTKIFDLQQMLVKPGSKICVEKPSSQAAKIKPQQVTQSQNFLGIPGEKHRFTTNNAKKDIQPGIRNYAENSNFKENPNKRYQPWGAPIEKIYNQQNIWQFPKQSVTMQREREITTQVLSRNRFQILADTELEEENCLLPDQTLHTFVGAQATTPTKSKQRDNCPGLANQDKQNQYGI